MMLCRKMQNYLFYFTSSKRVINENTLYLTLYLPPCTIISKQRDTMLYVAKPQQYPPSLRTVLTKNELKYI